MVLWRRNHEQCAKQPQNDRLKRDFLIWLREAKQRSPATVDQVRHAIDRYETYTGFKNFDTFNREQAIGFKHALLKVIAQRSGKSMSISTVHHLSQAIRDFFAWLHNKPGFRRAIALHDIAYLNLSSGEERQARTSKPRNYPSVADFRRAILVMPSASALDRRDRAMMALLLITGMRDAALVGLKMQDVDVSRNFVFQDPRHARTKFRKPIDTFMLPIDEDAARIFREWIEFLQTEMRFGPGDPVFPKTIIGLGEDQSFRATGFGREHWADAGPVRRAFAEAFARIGLSFTKPHTVRNTLVQFAYQQKFTAEQMKALSQNLGHESPMTTLGSYGPLTRERQDEGIAGLGSKTGGVYLSDLTPAELARALSAKLEAG
jgi:integrase